MASSGRPSAHPRVTPDVRRFRHRPRVTVEAQVFAVAAPRSRHGGARSPRTGWTWRSTRRSWRSGRPDRGSAAATVFHRQDHRWQADLSGVGSRGLARYTASRCRSDRTGHRGVLGQVLGTSASPLFGFAAIIKIFSAGLSPIPKPISGTGQRGPVPEVSADLSRGVVRLRIALAPPRSRRGLARRGAPTLARRTHTPRVVPGFMATGSTVPIQRCEPDTDLGAHLLPIAFTMACMTCFWTCGLKRRASPEGSRGAWCVPLTICSSVGCLSRVDVDHVGGASPS